MIPLLTPVIFRETVPLNSKYFSYPGISMSQSGDPMKRESSGKDDTVSNKDDHVSYKDYNSGYDDKDKDDQVYNKDYSGYDNKNSVLGSEEDYHDLVTSDQDTRKDDLTWSKDDFSSEVMIVTPSAIIKEFDINDIHNYTLQGLGNQW